MALMPWAARATMVGTEGCQAARWSESQKAGLSSDWSLQLDSMKSESLVIADQHAAVNTFPALVHTARHAMKAGSIRSQSTNLREVAVENEISDWGEVVTR